MWDRSAKWDGLPVIFNLQIKGEKHGEEGPKRQRFPEIANRITNLRFSKAQRNKQQQKKEIQKQRQTEMATDGEKEMAAANMEKEERKRRNAEKGLNRMSQIRSARPQSHEHHPSTHARGNLL